MLGFLKRTQLGFIRPTVVELVGAGLPDRAGVIERRSGCPRCERQWQDEFVGEAIGAVDFGAGEQRRLDSVCEAG